MRVTAQLLTATPSDRRTEDRRGIGAAAVVSTGSSAPGRAIVRDMSVTGALIESDAELEVGGVVLFGVAGMRRAPATIVRRAGQLYGIRFVEPIAEAELAAAGLANLVHFPTGEERQRPPEPEPEIALLPTHVRFWLIVGAATLLWVPIAAVGLSLLR